MPQCPSEKAAFEARRRGNLDLRAASGESSDPAEELVSRNSGIFRRQCVAASDQAHGPGAILDAHDPMCIEPAGPGGKDDMAASNHANWFALDQKNISGEYCREHASATRTESQFPEIT
jgi:hypothetical protein